ncbi:hypothetical protein U1Q18_029663 [Sarracenia purpurea var. burkii]
MRRYEETVQQDAGHMKHLPIKVTHRHIPSDTKEEETNFLPEELDLTVAWLFPDCFAASGLLPSPLLWAGLGCGVVGVGLGGWGGLPQACLGWLGGWMGSMGLWSARFCCTEFLGFGFCLDCMEHWAGGHWIFVPLAFGHWGIGAFWAASVTAFRLSFLDFCCVLFYSRVLRVQACYVYVVTLFC